MSFAYNSTLNKATGFSPFYLIFGRSSRLPIDSMFDIEVDGDTRRYKTYEQFVNTWKASMQEALIIVNNVTKRNRRSGTAYYNKKVFGSDIHIGDRILLRNLGERGDTGKLRSYWEDVVTTKDTKLQVFTIKPEEGGRERKVHRTTEQIAISFLVNSNRDYVLVWGSKIGNPTKLVYSKVSCDLR